MNDDQRRGLIEGLRLTRAAIDKRLDELERRLERGDDVMGEARIRREELRAAKFDWKEYRMPTPDNEQQRRLVDERYVRTMKQWPPDGEGQ